MVGRGFAGDRYSATAEEIARDIVNGPVTFDAGCWCIQAIADEAEGYVHIEILDPLYWGSGEPALPAQLIQVASDLGFEAAEGMWVLETTLGDQGDLKRAARVIEAFIDQAWAQRQADGAKSADTEPPTVAEMEQQQTVNRRLAEQIDRRVGLSSRLPQRLGADALVGDDLETFERKAAELSSKDRPVVVIPPLKDYSAALAKLERKPYGARGLTDLLRGSVLVSQLDDLPKVFAMTRCFVEEQGWTLHRLDDGFSSPSRLGYRNFSVYLRAPSGHVCELEFHVDSMWRAKFRGGGHALYKEWRRFLELGRPLTTVEKAAKLGLERESRRLYDEAFVAAGGEVIE